MSLARFEQKFSLLDQLPDALYAAIVTHHHGDLVSRVEGIMVWREALLVGELPEEQSLNWPSKKLARSLLMRLETLELASLCYQQSELTDSILLDICEGITSGEEFYSYKPDGDVDKLAQRQNIRDKNSSFKDEEGIADHVENTASDIGRDQDRDENPDKDSSADQNHQNGSNNP